MCWCLSLLFFFLFATLTCWLAQTKFRIIGSHFVHRIQPSFGHLSRFVFVGAGHDGPFCNLQIVNQSIIRPPVWTVERSLFCNQVLPPPSFFECSAINLLHSLATHCTPFLVLCSLQVSPVPFLIFRSSSRASKAFTLKVFI